MTLPATLSILSAAVGMLAALLALGMSTAPGRLDLRWFALCAAFAALVALSNVPATLRVPSEATFLSSRLGVLFGCLHAVAWYKYYAAQQHRPMSRWERAVVVAGVLVGVLSVVPGVVFSSTAYPHRVPGFDVIYKDPVPTRFGLVAQTYDDVALGVLLMRYVLRRVRGDRECTAQAIALGAVLGSATHDALALAGIFTSPYLLDLSMLLLVLGVGGALTRSFVANARELETSVAKLAHTNAELVRKERLAAVGELAAVVAHEVHHPLSVVFDVVTSLREPGAKREPLIAIMQEEAERLRDIVSDLLDFARPRPPVFAPAALDEVTRGAIDAACEVVGRKDVVVETCPVSLTCDERILRRAIVDLVTNALQAPERRGPVCVSLEETEDAVVLSVSDDGAGVAFEDRPRIFTPFFSKRPTGTGLGLAVVRACAEAHDGTVTLNDTPGGGATFTMRFPRRPARTMH